MHQIINNENKKVTVNDSLYTELKNEYANGTWMTIINVEGNVHCIILPDNF